MTVKTINGHLYETVASWHPVIIQRPTDWKNKIVYLPAWLNEHCPDGDKDYDAYVYHHDRLMDDNHRSIYFFRDERIALLFTLRWG